jgi:type 1 glutamine amidotransferase
MMTCAISKFGTINRSALRLVAFFCIAVSISSEAQTLAKALLITGNGNVPNYKQGYPPWIHEFHNEKVVEILRSVSKVDVVTDLSTLRPDQLTQYDLVISNSLFLTPDKDQLNALYDFVSGGKAYLTLHCGILSFLNWDKYEEFLGGIFIGGPSTVPEKFKVTTANIEFWGYPYSFRKQSEHPVSVVVDDFVIKDELYYFQPSTPDFHVIARAENLPVMWWHPVGKGKVMSLTLGHDETAKSNSGYQALLKHGVQWLAGRPLIYAAKPKVMSTRNLHSKNFMTLTTVPDLTEVHSIYYNLAENSTPEIFGVTCSRDGHVDIQLTGKAGEGKFTISANQSNGLSSIKAYDVRIVKDGVGNLASYHGNTAASSSNENNSGMFDAMNVLDDDPGTRWSSAPVDSAWISIDLQKNYRLKKLVLEWEASYARRYSILASSDGKKWTPIISEANGDGATDIHDFSPSDVRYIKINVTERFNKKWGYSLFEVKMYQE